MKNKIVFVYVAKGGENMKFNHRQMGLKSVKKILLVLVGCFLLLPLSVGMCSQETSDLEAILEKLENSNDQQTDLLNNASTEEKEQSQELKQQLVTLGTELAKAMAEVKQAQSSLTSTNKSLSKLVKSINVQDSLSESDSSIDTIVKAIKVKTTLTAANQSLKKLINEVKTKSSGLSLSSDSWELAVITALLKIY
jgi:maltodextrin utilization protein YvdJ